eukprot:764949-Hanusia_phi.AAC.1
MPCNPIIGDRDSEQAPSPFGPTVRSPGRYDGHGYPRRLRALRHCGSGPLAGAAGPSRAAGSGHRMPQCAGPGRRDTVTAAPGLLDNCAL